MKAKLLLIIRKYETDATHMPRMLLSLDYDETVEEIAEMVNTRLAEVYKKGYVDGALS